MKCKEKEEARRLRSRGWSIKEIAKALRVARSSVCTWVADIDLTEEQLRVLENKQRATRGNIVGQAQALKQAARVRHAEFKNQGYERAATDDTFRLICALYWGEGTKVERNRYFAISNSDPRF